jgi:hypothetical protein
MRTVVTVVAVGAVAWLIYRVVSAKRVGASVVSALRHPTVDPRVAGLVGHPDLQETRHGASHFQ